MFTLYSRFLYESDQSQLNLGWTGQAVRDSAVTLNCWSPKNTQLKAPFLVISSVFLVFLYMLINLLCHKDTMLLVGSIHGKIWTWRWKSLAVSWYQKWRCEWQADMWGLSCLSRNDLLTVLLSASRCSTTLTVEVSHLKNKQIEDKCWKQDAKSPSNCPNDYFIY